MYRLRQKGKYPTGRHVGEKAEKNFFKATMRRLSSGSDFRFRQFFSSYIALPFRFSRRLIVQAVFYFLQSTASEQWNFLFIGLAVGITYV